MYIVIIIIITVARLHVHVHGNYTSERACNCMVLGN